jgi:hypothetical protein
MIAGFDGGPVRRFYNSILTWFGRPGREGAKDYKGVAAPEFLVIPGALATT